MDYTLGASLKRKGIARRTLYKILVEKYGWLLCRERLEQCCRNNGVRNTPTWNTIRQCVKQEFGIEYRNGRWEVNDNER